MHEQAQPIQDAAVRIADKWAAHHRTRDAFLSSICGLWVCGKQKYPHPFDKVCMRIAEIAFLHATIDLRPELINIDRIRK